MAHQQATPPPRRSAFGRAVVWSLVAVSAIRGLRRPDAGPKHAASAPGSANASDEAGSAAVGSNDQAQAAGAGDGNASRPGGEAGAPTQIPPTGWWQVTRRAFAESTADNVGILAGGVAFFAFLAIPPALIAGLTLYGIVADPQTVARQMQSAGRFAARGSPTVDRRPAQHAGQRRQRRAEHRSGHLGAGGVVERLDRNEQPDGRGQRRLRPAGVARIPQAARNRPRADARRDRVRAPDPVPRRRRAPVAASTPVGDRRHRPRPGPAVGAAGRPHRRGAGVVYRLAPDRDAPQFMWTSPGAFIAALLWVLASLGFSLYVNNFGSYNKTYGALAGVIVLLLWLYLTSYIILLGAEINAESEKQTTEDTTGAAAADGRAPGRGRRHRRRPADPRQERGDDSH